MKLTEQQRAELKSLADEQSQYGYISPDKAHELANGVRDLLAGLEDVQRELENERARGIHTCHDNCTRDGCVNRRLREELADVRKQLAEAQALLVSGADLLGKVAMNAVDDFVCASGQKYADLMRQADSSALQFAIAEAVDPYRKDAERLDLLGKLCKEIPLRPNAFCSEIAPDTRLRYDFPTLVSYDSVGNQISLRDAIDAAIAAKGESE